MARTTSKMLTLLAAGVALTLGTAGKRDRLEPYERDHLQALSVWMKNEKKETKEFLKLETNTERDQWLKDKGYWDHFYKYSDEEQKQILGREPKLGWTQDMVYMAWGAPYDKVKGTKRTASETMTLSYRLQVTKDGKHLVYVPGSKATYKAVRQYTQELVLDDRVVTEIREKDGWQ